MEEVWLLEDLDQSVVHQETSSWLHPHLLCYSPLQCSAESSSEGSVLYYLLSISPSSFRHNQKGYIASAVMAEWLGVQAQIIDELRDWWGA